MASINPTRRVLVAGLALAGLGLGPARAAPEVTVYKDPECGCCGGWAKHLRGAGFAVTEKPVADLAAVKARAGVPEALQSCHTALVGGYVVEGHVPAADIQRLLKERPKVKGIAVGGMPAGSPGMEMPGRSDRYDVTAFLANGTTRRFASH